MAFSIVSSVPLTPNGTSSAINTTGAKLLVAFIADDGAASTFADSQTNTWLLAEGTTGHTRTDGRMLYCINPSTSAAHTFTSGNGDYPNIDIIAFTCTGTPQVDTTSDAVDSSAATLQGGAVTPSAAPALILSGCGFDNGPASIIADDPGFTVDYSDGGAGGVAWGCALAYYSGWASGAVNPTWSTGAGAMNVAVNVAFIEVAGGTDPTLTDVDTDEQVRDGQTGVAWTGTLMGTTNADRRLYIRGGTIEVDQTETGTGTATAATATIGILGATSGDPDLSFGSVYFGVERLVDSIVAELAGTLDPPTGQQYVNLASPGTGAGYISAIPALATGDQLQISGAGSSGGSAAPSNLVVAADASFSFPTGTPADFDVRAWDSSSTPPKWGSWATQMVGVEAVAVDAITLSDSSEAITARISTTVDTLFLTDSATSISMRVAVVSDAISFSDSAGAQVTTDIIADATDTLSFSVSAVSISSRLSIATDTLSLSDSAVSETSRLSVATDTVSLSASAVSVTSRPNTASDIFTVSDSSVAIFISAGDVFASDSINFSDSAVSLSSLIAIASDQIFFTDRAVTAGGGLGPVQGPGVQWLYRVQGRGVQGTGVPGVLQ